MLIAASQIASVVIIWLVIVWKGGTKKDTTHGIISSNSCRNRVMRIDNCRRFLGGNFLWWVITGTIASLDWCMIFSPVPIMVFGNLIKIIIVSTKNTNVIAPAMIAIMGENSTSCLGVTGAGSAGCMNDTNISLSMSGGKPMMSTHSHCNVIAMYANPKNIVYSARRTGSVLMLVSYQIYGSVEGFLRSRYVC